MSQILSVATSEADRRNCIGAGANLGDHAAQLSEKCLESEPNHGGDPAIGHAVDNLRQLVQICQTNKPLPSPLASWLVKSLEAYLAQECQTLTEAFGLQKKRGGVSWRVAANIQLRNEALRKLASLHFQNLAVWSQATHIHQISARYGATSWRFDRRRKIMPDAYSGTPREYLWRAFASKATMPVSARQLRAILA